MILLLILLLLLLLLLVSERSERDTIRGNTIENCLDVRMSFLYFWPLRFSVSSVVDPIPNFTKQNLLVYRSLLYHPDIEMFTFLNSFVGVVKTWKLTGVPFLFELVVVVSRCAILMVISRVQQYLLDNSLSTRLTTQVGMSSCVKVLCVTATT